MLERISPLRCCWWASAYSSARARPRSAHRGRSCRRPDAGPRAPVRSRRQSEGWSTGRDRRAGRCRRVQLVVEVVLDLRAREVAVEGLQILVGAAGAAVEQEYPLGGRVAEPFRPHVEGPLRGLDGDHLHPAAQHIIASAVVQIRVCHSSTSLGAGAAMSGPVRARAGIVPEVCFQAWRTHLGRIASRRSPPGLPVFGTD